jgi:pimeloyl-ACP methyl ester carboxylesterase
MAWTPTLPTPLLINGLNHIPPPSVEAFEIEFAGILPEGKSPPASWGVTRLYDFSPDADDSVRRVLLIYGAGTSSVGMAPLALRLKPSGSHVVIFDLWGHGLSIHATYSSRLCLVPYSDLGAAVVPEMQQSPHSGLLGRWMHCRDVCSATFAMCRVISTRSSTWLDEIK